MNNIFHVDIVRSDFKLMRLLLSKQATYDMLFGICFQNSVLACVVQFMNYNLENVPKCVNMNENTSIISMNSHSSLSKCQKINSYLCLNFSNYFCILYVQSNNYVVFGCCLWS